MLVHGGGQKGSGRAHQAAQARRRSPRSKSEELRAVGVPRVRGRRGPPPRRDRSTRRPPPSWSRPSARTSRSLAAAADQLDQRLPRRAADGREGQASTSAAGPRPSRSPSPTPRSGAAARSRSRSCAGPSTAAPPPVLVTSAFAGSAPAGWPATWRAPRGHARGRPGPRGRRAAVEAAHHPRPVPRLVRPAGSPARSAPSPRPTPTSRARRATRRTRSSGWCSPITGLRDAPQPRD